MCTMSLSLTLGLGGGLKPPRFSFSYSSRTRSLSSLSMLALYRFEHQSLMFVLFFPCSFLLGRDASLYAFSNLVALILCVFLELHVLSLALPVLFPIHKCMVQDSFPDQFSPPSTMYPACLNHPCAISAVIHPQESRSARIGSSAARIKSALRRR